MKNKKHNVVSVSRNKDDDEKKAMAQAYLNPAVLMGHAIKGQYAQDEIIDINAIIQELEEQSKIINSGELTRPENILTSQAHTLNALFAELIGRSRANMGEYFHASEKYMRLALKAQSQCRTTLETLAEIKNPRPYIQNNKAQYQQVNNGISDNHTRTEKIKSSNELLEDQSNDEQWMDTREAETAIRDDKEMETVEK
jgi:hypothetical protein